MATEPDSLTELIEHNWQSRADNMPTDAQVLFELLVLIVDIEYRIKYETSFTSGKGRGYSARWLSGEEES